MPTLHSVTEFVDGGEVTIKGPRDTAWRPPRIYLQSRDILCMFPYWTFIDDAELTHRDSILRGAVRVIGSSSIALYRTSRLWVYYM